MAIQTARSLTDAVRNNVFRELRSAYDLDGLASACSALPAHAGLKREQPFHDQRARHGHVSADCRWGRPVTQCDSVAVVLGACSRRLKMYMNFTQLPSSVNVTIARLLLVARPEYLLLPSTSLST